MKAKTQMKAKTRRQLEREVLELKAQLSSTYHFASATIEKASTKYLMASGALLQITAIGGRELIIPTVIRDGLSAETITAIKKDIKRSYDLSVMFAPKEEV